MSSRRILPFVVLIAALSLPVSFAQDGGAPDAASPATQDGVAAAPQVDPKALVARLESTVEAVLPHGKNAYQSLRSVRRKKPNASRVIGVLRKALRRAEATGESDADKATEACLVMADAAEAVHAAGETIGTVLLERETAIRKVATEKGEDSADFAKAMIVADILRGSYEGIWIAKVLLAIAPFRGLGTYEGMFDEHLPQREHYLAGFLALFTDGDHEANDRWTASEGVAQFAREEDKRRIIAACRELRADPEENPNLSERALFIMARIGDRADFDAEVTNIRAQLVAESKKEQPNAGALIQSNERIAQLYQGINEYEGSARAWARALGVYYQAVPYERAPADLRQRVGGNLYNYACALSRTGRTDLAIAMVEQSFCWGYNGIDWALRDGDLENARKDAAFGALIQDFRDGKKKAGVGVHSAEAFLKLNESMFKQSEEAAPAQDPKPAGDTAPAPAGEDKKG